MVSVDPPLLSAKAGLPCHPKCNSEVALSISHVSIEKENPVSLGMKHLPASCSPEQDSSSLRAFGLGGFPMLEIVTGPIGYIFKLSRGAQRPYSEQSGNCN